MSLLIRPHLPEDDPRLVAIHNRLEPDGPPLTLSAYREEQAGARPERWVAVAGEQAVGVGSFRVAWWTGRPDVFAMELQVDPEWRRRGLGTRLFQTLSFRLASMHAARMLVWVRSDSGAGLHFARRRGFRETGQTIEEYRLHVPKADAAAYAGGEERLAPSGIRIVSLAELGEPSESWLHALHAVWANGRRRLRPAPPARPRSTPGSMRCWTDPDSRPKRTGSRWRGIDPSASPS